MDSVSSGNGVNDLRQGAMPQPDSEEDMDRVWVDRVRDVIANTLDDPYAQSREIAKLRAEYLKFRFEKHVKVHEEPKQ